jgi:hypothetical protein
MVPIAQLPLVLVCDVALCVEVFELELAAVVAVAAVADVDSSDSDESPESLDVFVDDVALLRLVAAAAVWLVVVVVTPSRHASTPPSESMVATLSTVAALRARAARGLRRGREGACVGRAGVVVACSSSMTATVRMGGEASTRAG